MSKEETILNGGILGQRIDSYHLINDAVKDYSFISFTGSFLLFHRITAILRG